MKAIRVETNGGPEVLTLRSIDLPSEPGPGQVLVRVVVAGVNFMDVGQRRGTSPRVVPFTPGVEGSGVVEAVGEGVTHLEVKDRVAFVAFTSQPGAYSEYTVVDASRVIPLPDDFTFEQGAAFPLQGITAQYLINEFRQPTRGDFVLVHAAAGGVGALLVQWARHLGATVIGTVSSRAKAQEARALGAHHVILYTEHDFAAETKELTGGHGADLVLDGVGGTTCMGNLDAVAVRGSIVYFGASSGLPKPIDVFPLLVQRSISVSGASLAQLRTSEELHRRANEVIAGLREGWLELTVGGVFPLAQSEQAHRAIESRTSTGKLLLAVAEQSSR
ncbi:quinone oxidoreductase [Archangium minus]|uniref:Quinone oxidoreductase n=1 Tax=Archangium minus TaxID=83450 RepID=A0ABY9WNT0_9BACT|nr:quinone oxidoreductase [Archangium minus]